MSCPEDDVLTLHWALRLRCSKVGLHSDAAQVAGRYVGAHSKVVQPSRMARNDALAARLWDVSMQLTHQKPGLL